MLIREMKLERDFQEEEREKFFFQAPQYFNISILKKNKLFIQLISYKHFNVNIPCHLAGLRKD